MKINKKGISLIVLVITIIVIIIIAGAVILSLSENNPISQAAKATYLSDVKTFQTELDLYKSKQFLNKMGEYNPTLLQADGASVTYDGIVDTSITMNNLIPSLGKVTKYAGQFQVIDGKLVFQGSDTAKQDWTKEIGTEVLIAGEPRVVIVPPTETVVIPGTDIVYTIKYTSNAPLTTVDLTGKVEVLDNNGLALPIQPVINIGTVSGSSSDVIRYADVTIKTNTLVTGSYKLKIKSGSVTNSEGKSSTQDIISLIGFDVVDNIPPENPGMVANPASWTNGNVTLSMTYSSDSAVKEYSLDATNWNTYTSPVVVSENNTTVYARGKDASNNESGVATLTVLNIDKILPTVTLANGGSTTSSVTVTATANDLGGSELVDGSYQYSKDNGVTWTTATSDTSYTFNTLTTGTYQCKVKVVDNGGNSAISNVVAVTTSSLGTVSLVANPTTWTNGNVTVTVTYPSEIVTKQYSLDGTTWNTYTVPVAVTNNNTTVYAKGLDAGSNQTTQASITINNIDKIIPTITFGTNGASNVIVATTSVTASDLGGSELSTLRYVWDTQNTVTPSSGWLIFTNETTITKVGPGTYYLWINVKDVAGNNIYVKSNAFVTISPVFTFNYTGNYQTFTAPIAGTYQLQVWGAASSYNGRGGYSSGNITLAVGEVLNVYVGGVGNTGTGTANTWVAGGWNGGGRGYVLNSYDTSYSGGGATDIRRSGTALSNRIIVARRRRSW